MQSLNEHSGPQGELKRLHTESMPRETKDFRLDKPGFGKLRQLVLPDEMAGQAKRTAKNANATLRHAWAESPHAIENRLGFAAMELRTLYFQATQLDLGNYYPVSNLSTLREVEKGTAAPMTYEAWMRAWQEIAQTIDEPGVMAAVDTARDKVSELLVWNERNTTAGTLMRFAHKHGRDHLTVVSLDTVQKRLSAGHSGHFSDNLAATRVFVEEQKKEAAEQAGQPYIPSLEPNIAEDWDHPYMQQIRNAHLQDTGRFLAQKAHTPNRYDLLAQYFQMLIMHNGTGDFEAAKLRQYFEDHGAQIPLRDVKQMKRGVMLPPGQIQQMLNVLVAQRVIPESEATEVLAVWKKWTAEREADPDERGAAYGEWLLDRLGEHGVDKNLLKLVYPGSTGEDAVTRIKSAIRKVRLENPDIPLYDAICLHAGSLAEVSQELGHLLRYSERLPENYGKQYTRPYQVLAMFGLTPSDLGEEFADVEVEKYGDPEERLSTKQREMLVAANQVGQARAAGSINKWIQYHAPESVQEAAEYIGARSGRANIGKKAGMSYKVVNAMADGEAVATYPKLKGMVEGGGGIVTPELIIDWHLQQEHHSEETPLGKIFETLAHRNASSFAQYYEQQNGGKAGYKTVQGTLQRLRGDAPQGKDVEAVISALGIAQSYPTSVFAGHVCAEGNMHKALTLWCQDMIKAGQGQLIQGLGQLCAHVRKESGRTLEEAFEKKADVAEQVAGTLVYDPETDPRVEVLSLLPGVSRELLQTWDPSATLIELWQLDGSKTMVAPEPTRVPKAADELEDPEVDTQIYKLEQRLMATLEAVLNPEQPLPRSAEPVGIQVDIENEDFHKWFRGRAKAYKEFFPKAEFPVPNHHKQPETWADFEQLLGSASEHCRELCIQLASELYYARRKETGFNGKTPWQHQELLLFEIMRAIGNQHSTILLDGSPGSGKTLDMGVLLKVFRDLKARGHNYPGQGSLYLTARKAFNMQQTRSLEDRRARVLTINPEHITNKVRSEHGDYIAQAAGQFMEDAVPQPNVNFPSDDGWNALYDNLPATVEEGVVAFRELLEQEGSLEAWESVFSDSSEREQVERQAGQLLSRNALTFQAPDGDMLQLIEVTRPEVVAGGDDAEDMDFTADLTHGFRPGDKIYTESMWDTSKDRVPAWNEYDSAFLSKTGTLQHRTRQRLENVLNAQMMVVDEAGLTSGGEYLRMMEDAGAAEPIVIAATARHRAQTGRDRMTDLRYDYKLPRFSEHRAINGPDKVSPPIGHILFPEPTETHYPSGTYEAFAQTHDFYMRMFDEPFPLLEAQGRLQPWQGPHLMIVDDQLVPHAAMRLHQSLEGRPVDVISYTANKDERHASELQIALNDPMYATGERGLLVVGPAYALVDTLDIPHITSMWICRQENRGDGEMIIRSNGRNLHGRRIAYTVMQRFASEKTWNNTLLNILEPDAELPTNEDGQVQFAQGQILYGTEAAQSDTEVVAEQSIPTVASQLHITTGQYPPVPRANGEYPPKFAVQEEQYLNGPAKVEGLIQKTEERMAQATVTAPGEPATFKRTRSSTPATTTNNTNSHAIQARTDEGSTDRIAAMQRAMDAGDDMWNYEKYMGNGQGGASSPVENDNWDDDLDDEEAYV